MASVSTQQNTTEGTPLPLGVQFQTISQNESARRGKLVISSSNKSIDTPNLILYTKKGSPINLTPDLLSKLKEANTLQVGFQEMYPDVEALKDYKKGIHSFVHLEDKVLFVSFRDPTEYVEFPVSEKHMNINTKSGKKKVTPKEFMDMQKAIRADFFESLSVDVPHYITSKRIKKSVDTSLSWLDQSLKLQEKTSTIFGVIQGGNDLNQRVHSAKETSKRNVAGFVLGSFGLGESQEQRATLMKAVLKEISENKPRIAPGLGNPEEILQGVELGIDLFSTNYPSIITEWGCAFTFSLSSNPTEADGKLGYKINLHNRDFQLEATPLVANCPCYTCKNHTKAYIHHLLNVHELLATVLLTIHNTYHYLEFFKIIRTTLDNKTFAKFKHDFLKFVYFQTIENK